MTEPTKVKLTYYCTERRKHFVRPVLVDDDLDVKRKVLAAVFVTVTMEGGRKALMVQKIDGKFTATSGESASVPAYLFGPEYKRAQRMNPDDIWDLRRKAFLPLSKAA